MQTFLPDLQENVQEAAADTGTGQVPGIDEITEVSEPPVAAEILSDPRGEILRYIRICFQLMLMHFECIHQTFGKIVRAKGNERNLADRTL